MSDLLTLAERCEAATSADNLLDVLCEVALFKPSRVFIACRSNNAGTKVVYRDQSGNNVTCWAEEWTAPERRKSTAAALRARFHALP